MAGVDPSQPPRKTPVDPEGQPVRSAAATPREAGAARPQSPAAGTPRPRAARQKTAKTVVLPGVQADEAVGEEEVAKVLLRSAPPWLISALLHMSVLIVLGLIAVSKYLPNSVELSASQAIYAEELGLQTLVQTPLGADTDKMDETIITPDNLRPVSDPFAAPARMQVQLDGGSALSDIAAHLGMAFQGREAGSKKTMLGKFGGTEVTEATVQLGLNWLSRQQGPDGSWSLRGPYSEGSLEENNSAATAMALLAFQGAGNTHQSGQWKAQVAKGWNWLLKQQGPDGDFFPGTSHNHRFYTQGQCTIVLCELYGMTKDSTFREPAKRAVNYCIKSQSPKGGWRYRPQEEDADVSVTGWVLMGLQSARMAGLRVPPDVFRLTEQFLDRVGVEKGSRYPYREGGEITLPMTAEGLLCRQYLGWNRNDDRLQAGAEWLTQNENLISYGRTRNEYYWYYAAQVCHHLEGQYWQKWNARMRQEVPKQQVTVGKEAGSWNVMRPNTNQPATDMYVANGGRLVATCLSIYMLEVYYRHMPLYSKIPLSEGAE